MATITNQYNRARTIGATGDFRDAPAGGPHPKGIGTSGSGQLAYTRQVQPNETVQHQLTGLLASNSPYMEQARLAGERTANSRGLLNSSIAAGASQAEAIKAGLPIASQDASTYAGAASENMGAMNSAIQQRRDLMNRMALGELQSRTSLGVAGIGAAAQRYGYDMSLLNNREGRAFEGEQAGLDRAHEFGMTGYRTQMQDWLQSNQFNRQAHFDLATLPLQQSVAINTMLAQQYAMNPDLWDPNTAQGFYGFFNDEIFGQTYDTHLGPLLDYYWTPGGGY